jgi:hypothetical protein
MQRRVSRQPTEELLGKLRKRIPELVLRTTFITGFPGETDAQFEEMVDFARQWRFERVGVFTYSLEPDTPAAKLDGHLPEEVKAARRDQLMEVQQGIAHDHARRQVGRIVDCIVDGPSGERDDVWLARSTGDAPDIDCLVYLTAPGTSPAAPLTGRILPVEVVAEPEAADVLLSLRGQLGRDPDLRRRARVRGVPILVIKSDSPHQLQRALERLVDRRSPEEPDAKDPAGGLDDDHAGLEECRLAVEQVVLPQGRPVELLPRSEPVRQMQAELVNHYRLRSAVFGRGQQQRLRVFPA